MEASAMVYEGTWEELTALAPRFQGHRLRLTILPQETPAGVTLEERRAFLRLPLAERRRVLAEQAEALVAHYETNTEWRELLQGDIVEY